jgi:hypothetical protein
VCASLPIRIACRGLSAPHKLFAFPIPAASTTPGVPAFPSPLSAISWFMSHVGRRIRTLIEATR